MTISATAKAARAPGISVAAASTSPRKPKAPSESITAAVINRAPRTTNTRAVVLLMTPPYRRMQTKRLQRTDQEPDQATDDRRSLNLPVGGSAEDRASVGEKAEDGNRAGDGADGGREIRSVDQHRSI